MARKKAKKKKPPLGSGERFRRVVKGILRNPKFKPRKPGQSREEAAKAIAASMGRKKYGAEKMARWAAAGRRRKLRAAQAYRRHAAKSLR